MAAPGDHGAAPEPCPRCGAGHWLIACPAVKAVEFEDADPRLIRRVEFMTPADMGPPPDPGPNYPRMTTGAG